MKKALIILSSLLVGIYLVSALDLDLSSGDNLTNTSWDNISNITGKINLSSNNLDISGKLVSSGKICAGNTCLGECSAGNHWDGSSATCVSDTKSCSITNGTGSQTWTGSSRGTCNVVSCNSGYVESGNTCITPDGNSQNTAGNSCYTIKQANASATNGTYWIDPNGGDTSDAFEVYCDMTTDGGGWTYVVGIGADNNHYTQSSVTTSNLKNAGGKGKFSDFTINQIRTTGPGYYKFDCYNRTIYITNTCNLNSTDHGYNSLKCSTTSTSLGGTYTQGNPGPAHAGAGSRGGNYNIIYNGGLRSGTGGCYNINWRREGALWVR